MIPKAFSNPSHLKSDPGWVVDGRVCLSVVGVEENGPRARKAMTAPTGQAGRLPVESPQRGAGRKESVSRRGLFRANRTSPVGGVFGSERNRVARERRWAFLMPRALEERQQQKSL